MSRPLLSTRNAYAYFAVPKLRRTTGCSANEARAALDHVGNDYDRALDWLRRNMRMLDTTPTPGDDAPSPAATIARIHELLGDALDGTNVETHLAAEREEP